MDDFAKKLNAVLENPEMMAQIMSLAQQMGQPAPSAPTSPPPPPPDDNGPGIDMALLSRLAGAAGSMGVDNDQRALLRALGPYISGERIGKLEKAMRAAKLASFATTILDSNILSQTGR